MTRAFPYVLRDLDPTCLGLIVLQSDETVEHDFRRLLPDSVRLLVSRVPSGAEVTPETLGAMEGHLTEAAALFPEGARFDAVGYACTSGTAHIGAERVAERVRAGTLTRSVTNPVTALVEACRSEGVGRIAFLSPYMESVSNRIRTVLAEAGVETPVFGTFGVPEEAKVARIHAASIRDAARALVATGGVDALFMSCTNLDTLGVIGPLEAELGLPVFSSNLVLGWHMLAASGARTLGRPADLLHRI
jgi:maleate isomerase